VPVIVHLADTQFATPERGDPNKDFPPGTWPGPGFDEATRALAARGVRQLGVALRPSTGDVVSDLEAVATATGTVAPDGGVDCDGDGTSDRPPGDPLVCLVDADDAHLAHIADVIVGLLQAVRDDRPVELVASGDTHVVSAITPGSYPAVDVNRPNVLTFDVTFSCSLADAGRTFPVRLRALVGGKARARAATRVVCGVPPSIVTARPPARPEGVALVPPQPPIVPPPPQAAPAAAQAPALGPAPCRNDSSSPSSHSCMRCER
jgi:hypothetical protein